MTCGVGGVQTLSACCWLQVRRMIGRCDSDRMRKNRHARGRMDMVEASEKVDDRSWSKRGVNRQMDLETCISKTNFVQKRVVPFAWMTTSIASYPNLFRAIVLDDDAFGTILDLDLATRNALRLSSTPTPNLIPSRTRRTRALMARLRTPMLRIATL